MGVLDKLTIVALAPKVKRSLEQDRRVKLVEQLAEQLKLVEAALGGTAYRRGKAVWVMDDMGNRSKVQRLVKLRQWMLTADGAKQLVTVPKRVKGWWRMDAQGNCFLAFI